MRKDYLKNIIKEVSISGETSRSFMNPTIEEVEYLYSKGIATIKQVETCRGLNGSWTSEYFLFTRV